MPDDFGAAGAHGKARTGALDQVELRRIEHGPCAHDRLRYLGNDRPQGLERHRRAQRDLEYRQAAFDEGPGQRYGRFERFDGQHRDHRRPCGDGGDVPRPVHRQTLQPPSITLTVPVVKADSSLAR